MSKYLIDSLKQKFELHSYKVYFSIDQSLIAEEILDGLDRAKDDLIRNLGLAEPPSVEIYVYPDHKGIERATKRPLAQGETFRLIYEDNSILHSASNLQPPVAERLIREVAYLVFNNNVKEKEVGVHRLRTPSWLREGICLQSSLKYRPDSRQYLLEGWTELQTALKANQLIRPSMMIKNLSLIPDSQRRKLAFHQAYFMVKLLMTMYCDGFFKKYSTLMGALEDMEAENTFRQLTGFDFEKFFGLFEDWVRTTNVWNAIE